MQVFFVMQHVKSDPPIFGNSGSNKKLDYQKSGLWIHVALQKKSCRNVLNPTNSTNSRQPL